MVTEHSKRDKSFTIENGYHSNGYQISGEILSDDAYMIGTNFKGTDGCFVKFDKNQILDIIQALAHLISD